MAAGMASLTSYAPTPRCTTRATLARPRSPLHTSNMCRRTRAAGRARMSVSASNGASKDTAKDDSGRTLEFEAKLGQNVRQGMQGWDTKMVVNQPSPETRFVHRICLPMSESAWFA
eukprot:2870631-Pyramimonas_sp.AAC.1